MFAEIAEDLLARINHDLPFLRSMTPERAAAKPADGGWSPKEELGHLIDSATNNHQRFVRALVQGEFRGDGYAQDEWVKVSHYQAMEWNQIVDVWHSYNTLLAHLIQHIPDSRSNARVVIAWDGPKPLGFIVEDYVIHMQHHVDHLLARDEITPYPPLELASSSESKTV
jgi:hypothetical protein